MYRFSMTLVCATLCGAGAFIPFSAHALEAPVSRVILSTSGLAHFEHDVAVSGAETLTVPMRLDQVDDALKSLVVFDPAGKVGALTLPGRQPLAEAFRDLPFSADDLNDPMRLLSAYQGANVTVTTTGGQTITGLLVSVKPEEERGSNDTSITRHRITVMADTELRQALLEDASAVTFNDASVRAQIAQALAAVRENASAEQRILSLNLDGSGPRNVTLAYVVGAPLWKTAYRLVLPRETGETGLLQGWAVIENMTGGDWTDVGLTLVSGNPVTYRQALYESYYVTRPEIPVEIFGKVMPRMDTGAINIPQAAPAAAPMQMKAARGRSSSLMAMDYSEGAVGNFIAEAAPGTAEIMADQSAPFAGYGGMDMAAAMNVAAANDAGTQVLFAFNQKYSLKAGESMMLPFVSRSPKMERVSLYQPDVNARHPLAAVKIVNDGDSALPPGILTLYEENTGGKGTSFVGDAKMPEIAAKDSRMVSYALDAKTTIDSQTKQETTRGHISISKGVMRIRTTGREESVYTIKAPATDPRRVVIEHPRQTAEAKLVSPAADSVETTETHYRLPVDVKADETATLNVVIEHPKWETVRLLDRNADWFFAQTTANGELDAATRRTFEKLAELRRTVDEAEGQFHLLDQRKAEIFTDQARLRENITALGSGKSDIKDRYLSQLDAQETELADINNKIIKTRAEVEKRKNALKDAIMDIEIGDPAAK